MQYDRNNKTDPHVRYRVSNHIGRLQPVHTWDIRFWVSKFKDGVYRPKHRYTASNVPRNDGRDVLLRDTERYIKAGKYHDWFFASKEE